VEPQAMVALRVMRVQEVLVALAARRVAPQ